ncbi:hypothetical protein AAG906_029160 [Vitis piasezkii]
MYEERDKANIGLKLNITATSLLQLLASAAEASGDTIFDVTKYGDKVDGNTDITQALLKAWGDACALPVASTVMIPNGRYTPINFIVEGTVKASVDTSRFKAEAGWIAFRQIIHISLRFNFITNNMVKDITSRDNKQFHINLLGCRNWTFYNVAISAPEDSLNTDGIHIGHSSGIHITDSTIETGDDCVSIGDGSEQINIQRYPNEEPVVGTSVKNCTFTNTQNGVRVKT